jgi:hypothetical protein
MRYEDHPIGGQAEHAGDLERLVDERLRADGCGRQACCLKGDYVVQTARHARSSIAETLDRQITVDLDLSEQFARRVARERRLDEPVRGCALG